MACPQCARQILLRQSAKQLCVCSQTYIVADAESWFLSCAQGWRHGTNGTALYQMLQQSFAWLSTTGFPTTQPNVTLKFPVIVTALGPGLSLGPSLGPSLSTPEASHRPLLASPVQIAYATAILLASCAQCLSELSCCTNEGFQKPVLRLMQDQAFMHDFELFANNLDGSSKHTNITSWAW